MIKVNVNAAQTWYEEVTPCCVAPPVSWVISHCCFLIMEWPPRQHTPSFLSDPLVGQARATGPTLLSSLLFCFWFTYKADIYVSRWQLVSGPTLAEQKKAKVSAPGSWSAKDLCV